MLDVVGNHMGNTFDDFSHFYPFNSSSHYHRYCLIRNYNNQREVEYCRIGDERSSLADLDTENPFVIQELQRWLRWVVDEFDFDGIRIDTVKHVPRPFWSKFTQGAPGVFSIGEVLHGDPAYVGEYQNNMDSMLNFPLYFTIRDVFQNKASMWQFEVRYEQNRQYFRDASVLGNFVDNHDFKRFLNEQRDDAQLRNALTYIMLAEGIPVVYYGTELHFDGGDDPRNRESFWPDVFRRDRPRTFSLLKKLNGLRKHAGEELYRGQQRHLWTQDDVHVFMRGQAIVVVTNVGKYSSLERTIRIPVKKSMLIWFFDYLKC
jgi:alpha-amylase